MQKNPRPTSCDLCPSKDKGIFCNLEKHTINDISINKVMNVYKKGQTIFYQGNPPFGLYCVSSGKIKISKMGNDGKESIVRIAGPGDVLGHRSLFSNENYTSTATVIEEATVCFLDKQYIYTSLQNNSKMAMNLIEKLSKEMNAAESKNASMSQKSARERLSELLLEFMKTYGVEENNRIRLNIKLNRDEIASMVGTAHETIIRLISELKQEGILEQEGKVIFIKDQKKLAQFANVER